MNRESYTISNDILLSNLKKRASWKPEMIIKDPLPLVFFSVLVNCALLRFGVLVLKQIVGKTSDDVLDR